MSSVGGTPSDAVRRDAAPIQRIAVLRPNHRLGNTLLLSPLMQELERHFPEAHIELVSACGAASSLFQRYPQVSTTHLFPGRSYRHPLQVLGKLAALRRERFDVAIDPTLRSRAGRFLLQYVRARDRIGFHWGVSMRDYGLTHRADPALAPAHFAQAPLYLLRSAYFARRSSQGIDVNAAREGAAAGEGADPVLALDLRLTESERREGERRLASVLGVADGRSRPRLALFAHATGQKGYPVEWWRELISSLRREAPTLQMLEIVPEDRRPRLSGAVPGVYTPDLRLLAATLAATSLFVIADGGVMHLAEAAGARVLGLFRSTAPARYGPVRGRSEALWAPDASAEEIAQRIRGLVFGPAEIAAS